MYIDQSIQHQHFSPQHRFMPAQDCLFVSGEDCFVGQGIRRRFQLPATNTELLVQTVQHCLANESEQTKLFGVIPFDKQQPAQFILPQQLHHWDKTAFTSWLGAELANREHQPNQLVSTEHFQSQSQFESMVQKAQQLFATQQLTKIVLSKQLMLSFAQPVDQHRLIYNLLSQNRHGFPFTFPTATGALLTGVSPELLLRQHQDLLTTNPLAGSVPRGASTAEDAQLQLKLSGSAKDQIEHAIVVMDIQQVLSPFCQQLSIPVTPALLGTATMWHLSSLIQGRLTDAAGHVLTIANQLHPTPALCGHPGQLALQHILRLENHSRGLFSGIVGWCDKQGNGEWVVVIRCAQVRANQAKLFAGAGIVPASVPADEWYETEAKLKTMLQALEVHQQYANLTKTS
jgi:isochorismate synthase